MAQDPENNHPIVPMLSQLAIGRVADLIGQEELPMSDCQIHVFLTNVVISTLRRNKSWNFGTLERILTSDQFVIDTVDLKDIEFNYKDLKMCLKHNLVSFCIGDFNDSSNSQKIFVNRVLEAALNQTSCKQLKHLDLSGSKPLDLMWPKYVAKKLKALKTLSFANRVTTPRTFAQFRGNFSQLRLLNISNTRITDIGNIAHLCNLEVFIMHDLNISTGNIEVLTNLKKLKKLDISRNYGGEVEMTTDTHLDLVLGIYSKSVDAIENGTTTPWTELQALDISGLHFVQQGTDQALAFLEKIVQAHPQLTEIGLLGTPLGFVDVQVPGRDLQIYNEASLKSLNTSLSHYTNANRPEFVEKILWSIFSQFETNYVECSPEDLKECLCKVFLSLQRLKDIYVQLNGIYCLFETCMGARVQERSLREVRKMIKTCLDVIEYRQSTMNAAVSDELMDNLRLNVFQIFNTLWDENFVETEGINLYRLTKVSLESMIRNTDEKVDQEIMRTLCIVTPKLKQSERKEFKEDDKYVKEFVKKMVVLRAKFRRATNEIDKADATETLHNTFTVLWFLMNYNVFLEAGGIKIAIRILKTFQDIDVQIRMLWILTSIVDRVGLPLQQLCESKNISMLLSCLDGDFQETDPELLNKIVKKSHIAASLLKCLLVNADGLQQSSSQKKELSQKLLETVSLWPERTINVCSYSEEGVFDDFYNDITVSKSNGVSMFVIWTAFHMLIIDDEKEPNNVVGYINWFLESQLCLLVEDLADGHSEHIEELDNRVVLLAKKLLEYIDANH